MNDLKHYSDSPVVTVPEEDVASYDEICDSPKHLQQIIDHQRTLTWHMNEQTQFSNSGVINYDRPITQGDYQWDQHSNSGVINYDRPINQYQRISEPLNYQQDEDNCHYSNQSSNFQNTIDQIQPEPYFVCLLIYAKNGDHLILAKQSELDIIHSSYIIFAKQNLAETIPEEKIHNQNHNVGKILRKFADELEDRVVKNHIEQFILRGKKVKQVHYGKKFLQDLAKEFPQLVKENIEKGVVQALFDSQLLGRETTSGSYEKATQKQIEYYLPGLYNIVQWTKNQNEVKMVKIVKRLRRFRR